MASKLKKKVKNLSRISDQLKNFNELVEESSFIINQKNWMLKNLVSF